MTAPLTLQRARQLTGALTELKARARTLLATELAGAVGTAVRDALVAALVDRLVRAPHQTPSHGPHAGGRRPDEYDHGAGDPWGDPHVWDADGFEPRVHTPTRPESDAEPAPVPVTAAVTVGARVGRWWLARHGSAAGAVGLGALAAALGLAGGPLAHAALAVLAAAADVLTAEAALDRS